MMRRAILAVGLMLAALPAMAQTKADPVIPSHTIDMTQGLKTYDGKPMNGPDGKPITLGHAIAQVLMGVPDKTATLQDLLARAALAKRIEDNPKAELTAPETALIDKMVVEGFSTPGTVAAIVPLIDPNMKPGPIKP